jgi:hypothetical protein
MGRKCQIIKIKFKKNFSRRHPDNSAVDVFGATGGGGNFLRPPASVRRAMQAGGQSGMILK